MSINNPEVLMLLLVLLALVAGVVAAVARSAPRLVRTLAVPIVVAAAVLAVAIEPAPLVVAAAVVVASCAVAVVLNVDLRYLLTNLIPVPFESTYSIVGDDGTMVPFRSRWVQWRGHVVRHRSLALSG